MRPLPFLLGVAIVLGVMLGTAPASAQRSAEPPAAARFHEGARLYVDGEMDAAAWAVDAGLAEAPADARLRALRDLIRQQQDGGGSETPDDADSSDESEDDGPPNPSSGDGPEAPPDDAPPAGDAGGPPAGADQAPGAPQPTASGMSRAEAEALLDAVGGDERLLLRDLRRQPTTASRPERDW